jgi:hypothetical protein
MQTFLQIKNLHDPNFGPYEWSKVDMDVGPGIVAVPFLASTIVLNAYCTGESVDRKREKTTSDKRRIFVLGLLVWRIWKTLKHRDNEDGSAPGRLQFLIRIFMESGVFFLSISIAHFLVYFGHDNFAIHMIGTLVRLCKIISYRSLVRADLGFLQNTIVIGIAYNLIIIRVGINRTEEDARSPGNQQLSTLVFSSRRAEGISTTSVTTPRLGGKECV